MFLILFMCITALALTSYSIHDCKFSPLLSVIIQSGDCMTYVVCHNALNVCIQGRGGSISFPLLSVGIQSGDCMTYVVCHNALNACIQVRGGGVRFLPSLECSYSEG